MSEAAGAIAESTPLKESKFALVELEDSGEGRPATPPAEPRRRSTELGSEDDDDFVVYSDASSLNRANDISHKFESHTSDSATPMPLHSPNSLPFIGLQKSEIPNERHEIRFDDVSDDEASEPLRLTRSADSAPQMLAPEEAQTSFQDVPLLQTHPEGGFFNGLVFCDTVDSLYRPVVVINTRAIPHKSLRTAALRHLREALEPVVSTGPYVLIFTSFSSSTLSKLPISWILAAYRELSYPFRKNVQHVILVRPNKLLKAFVRIMKVVVKKKAHSKVKQILYLGEIENVTHGEVTLEHLSPKVIQALSAEELTYSDISLNN